MPYLRLFTAPTFIGSVLASFGAYWALTLGLTWFTAFIVQGLGFAQKDAGWISILPWIFGAVDVLLTGWISQVMMARSLLHHTADKESSLIAVFAHLGGFAFGALVAISVRLFGKAPQKKRSAD